MAVGHGAKTDCTISSPGIVADGMANKHQGFSLGYGTSDSFFIELEKNPERA